MFFLDRNSTGLKSSSTSFTSGLLDSRSIPEKRKVNIQELAAEMKLFRKTLKKLLSYLMSPFVLGLIVTVVITYIALDYYASRHDPDGVQSSSTLKLLQQIHEKSIDWRLNDRGPQPGSDRVAILAIDEKSIEQEGRWPWPRDKMAKLVERTLDYGAKSVSFDIIFSEEDANSSIPTLTRLKRTLLHKQQLSGELEQLFASEIERSNADRIFADTIQHRADRLILGAYFEDYIQNPPYADYCIDTLFGRTYESRYWNREAIKINIQDDSLQKIDFPPELKEHLGQYFTLLEVLAASRWFQDHPQKAEHITEALESLSTYLPPEAYPGFATLWLNDDVENAILLFQEANPDLAKPEGIRMFFSRFGSAFAKKEQADLQAMIRRAGASYCNRFFSKDDELLSLEAHEKIWGTGDDIKQQFEEYSYSKLWSHLGKQEPLEKALDRFKTDTRANALPNVLRWWVNIPLISDGTKHSGYFNAVQDTDGSIRRGILMVRRGNSYMPSLSFKTFLVDHGYSAKASLAVAQTGQNKTPTKVISSFEVDDAEGKPVMKIPVDPQGHLMINYAGGSKMFPHISAADLLSDSPEMIIEVAEQNNGRWGVRQKKVNKTEFLKDKLLIAGATAIGVYDLRVTPFEENYPGVETHANVLSNLLVEHDRIKGSPIASSAPGFMQIHPSEEKLMWIVLLGVGVILSALLTYFGSLAGLAITGAALSLVYVIDRYFLFKSGIVVTILFPTLLISSVFICLTFYKYFTEERKKRELKGTFEKYVSPAIVAEVLSDPENIELGGKKMELTVMFSDVRGFTTISEKLDPRALSDLLNSYLTPMTNLVFANKGTLDKYMGDAVMAFWGAPIHFPDHAKHACRCALQMIDKLKELQETYRAQGLPEIDIGIGLNTGDMSVGNMGSDTVRSYTVMGDAVNLGSRLEGINKQYGTRIIISEFTQAAIKDDFVTREVDWVRVKGKAQPVRIFELVGEGKLNDKKQQVIQLFNEGFELYHTRAFTPAIEKFTQALTLDPEDAPSELYIERCQDYLKEPPPEDWDGVFTMTSK